MGIKERRERDKAKLRTAILTTAREMAASEGWANVSIRKIADQVEYSAPIIYEHFDDKEALLLALVIDGFKALHAVLHQARLAAPDPEAALIEMALAYLRFARESPELYQVMHGLDGVRFHSSEKLNKPREIEEVVIETCNAIQQWADFRHVQLASVLDNFEIYWATGHGFASLEMSGRLPGDLPTTDRLVEKAVRDLVFAWRQGA
jgi:AcrR family transcriptional regulator